ncbi:MAG: hypothetical protein ACLQVJ_03330 [Syntrophobacteraceae bacterium]
MEINTHTLSKLVRLIVYYINCPFPGGRLEIPPAIEGAVYRNLRKARKQLNSSEKPKPDRVAKSMRALYGLIGAPFKKAAEHNHTQFRKFAEQNLVKPQFVELFVSIENELIAAFEEAGTSPNRCKRSKQ